MDEADFILLEVIASQGGAMSFETRAAPQTLLYRIGNLVQSGNLAASSDFVENLIEGRPAVTVVLTTMGRSALEMRGAA